ncbi:HAMP domain-containing sensor histidine kinase [Polaribacter undariae]|uniref:histidine kinase n=1 Tax=Polaribacter sejongensis TaxID=985043 RepID=A0AAJ1R1R4_9FLAO|nr:HAMP domain-containing sensor histidine kinase [Polaribacter undariae]MDN3621380.1 HAMP domain-containing sensor histidine kinase [Polaribacter undariae]UWD31844.1 HAMP domain-containing histidine kinase [Polaribacter undariae]
MDNQNANRIPFKVSARTARLIGRENIANSKGAIIELVKNGYDADSKICIVYFDNKYSTLLNEIDEAHFNELINKGIEESLISDIYEFQEDYELYSLKNDVDDNKKSQFKTLISKFSTLYIIDAGEGMTQNIIRDHWMTIGTDNKANSIFTKSGRVKAGAKGIGRFALDRLGGKCEMTTIFNSNPEIQAPDTDIDGNPTDNNGYKWIVNWEDFEGDYKTIDSVGAILIGLDTDNLKEELLKVIPEEYLSKIESEEEFKFGTILKINDLRDNWEDYFVDQVYSDLEVLVPPKESGGFEIYVFSSLLPEKYGEVLGSICDDFDYKLVASADENQNVKITVYRNEYNVELIPNGFFQREAMLKENYKKSDFIKGFWSKTTTFSNLLKGFKEIDEDNIFDNIGLFDFTFYFLKRATNSVDSKRFFNRNFMSHNRKDWLNKFGGIKLFRDNFRVRPYGEVNNVAFDWLGLGNRKSTSPAGIAKKEGGYKVEPENVAGAISISRLTNVNFEDKSSREGLQENKTFKIFTLLIAEIISEFEKDRSYIAREMDEYDNILYGPERDREKAEKLKNEIIAKSRAKKESKDNNSTENNAQEEPQTESDKEKEILASELDRKEEEIEKLKDEQKILRGLASSGIVLASFSHDLSKLNDVLASRTEKLKTLMLEKISESDYTEIRDSKNPFKQIERIKKQDLKLQNWLNFSLGATRKDKRKRKQLFLKPYFLNFKNDWETVLSDRGISMDITEIEDLDMRVFEIDIDSVFNNLFVNSIDAFIISKEERSRVIKVKVSSTTKEIIVDYYDNGPGLSKDISEPEVIFEPLYTTRRNLHTGEEEGTGLGMWLIKSIVEENDGKTRLLYPEIGFGLRITFPIKYKR